MDCRTTPAVEFRSRLCFKNQDPITTQEQSVLTKISKAFSAEEIIFQYSILGFKIDAYFLKYKLAVEVDERGHQDIDLECEIERQKALGKELDCKFIRINPSKESLSFFDEISRIHNYIINSREKSLLKIISTRLLGLEFKSDNSVKTKCLKWIVKKIIPEFNN